MKRIYKYMINLVLTVSILAGAVSLTLMTVLAAPNTVDEMKVHFIDVGQGDSTLITCGGHSMLIDAGDDSKGTAIQNYLKKQKIEKLDYLILTHPDADHIGGAPVIITKFNIDKVFVSNYEKDNKTYQKLIQALDNKRLKYETPKVGSQYILGSATITILAPNDEYDNPNDSSIALIIQNGNNKFLFTGDSGENAENDILDNKIDISADVYKVGHHGSRYSTSKDFFKAVNPTYAVISCGENNSYGYPHAETLNTLRTNGVKVYRTDEAGTIIATSDGKKITFNVPASDTWKAGEPVKTENSKPTTKPESNSNEVIEPEPQSQSQNENSANVIEEPSIDTNNTETAEITYVLNTNTKKFHYPTCSSVNQMSEKNKQVYSGSRDEIISMGYVPCKRCNP